MVPTKHGGNLLRLAPVQGSLRVLKLNQADPDETVQGETNQGDTNQEEINQDETNQDKTNQNEIGRDEVGREIPAWKSALIALGATEARRITGTTRGLMITATRTIRTNVFVKAMGCIAHQLTSNASNGIRSQRLADLCPVCSALQDKTFYVNVFH